MTDAEKIQQAIKIAVEYGGIDGAHHKDWVIDQMVRALAESDYEKIVADACKDENGETVYEWNTGIAP